MRRYLPVLCSLVLVLQPGCSDEGAPPPDVAAADAPRPDAAAVDAGIDGPGPDTNTKTDTAASDTTAPDTASPHDGASDAAPWTCPTYSPPVIAGLVLTLSINETSGLAVSSKNAGVLWLHNDSGDSPRVFAISSTAALLGEYALSGAKAADWEDMARGPGPTAGESYLYLGDIGDNPSARSNITVYRVVEPTVPVGGPPAKVTLSGVETLTFVYPDGPHNAETLLVDPGNGDLYIVTKTGASPAGIYRSPAPQGPGTTRTLTKIGTVALGTNITGGDVAHDGSEVLLRTYGGAHLWHWPAGTTLSAALAVSPCKVPAASEPQGEAIAFVPVTRNYYTLSENNLQPLYLYVRK